jgi:hypothetical protein
VFPKAEGAMIGGVCACKGVAFEVRAVEPVGLDCYCEICRTIAGAPYSAVVLCERADLTLLRGAELLSRYTSSPDFVRIHCGTCHAPLWGEVTHRPAPLFVSAGALDPASIAHVVFDHIFVRSLVPWHRITDDRPRFDTFREGGVVARLEEYVEAHNKGRKTRSFAALASLFHREGELVFVGIPIGPFVGRERIEKAFVASPPSDDLVLFEPSEPETDVAECGYGWAESASVREGTLRLESEMGQIRRLTIRHARNSTC